ncbi:MAG: hypothetical protein JNM90_16455 [Burkholderiales bacterium]|nr:hypothetical protein [Burkholderiales bacterium]
MQRAADEKLVAEAPFGFGPLGGTVTLTERRLVLCAGATEQSIPLRALTSVRAGFARDLGGAVAGAVILALALSFAAAYRPMETGLNRLGMAIEKRMSDKAPEGEAYGRYLYVPAGVVWLLMLPFIGWGGYKLVAGAVGETELVLTTASGELRRSGRGRHDDLIEFGAEVGRWVGR